MGNDLFCGPVTVSRFTPRPGGCPMNVAEKKALVTGTVNTGDIG